MPESWKIIKGTNQILLVASHNYPSFRSGKIKPADIGTGKIVEDLCELTDSWGIISESIQPDPNWYRNSDFRRKVKNLIANYNIHLVIDIHGRRDSWSRPIDFYPNTQFKKSFPKILEKLSPLNFKDNNQLTLIEDLDNEKIAGLELEIRKDNRLVGTEEYRQNLELIKNLLINIT